MPVIGGGFPRSVLGSWADSPGIPIEATQFSLVRATFRSRPNEVAPVRVRQTRSKLPYGHEYVTEIPGLVPRATLPWNMHHVTCFRMAIFRARASDALSAGSVWIPLAVRRVRG